MNNEQGGVAKADVVGCALEKGVRFRQNRMTVV